MLFEKRIQREVERRLDEDREKRWLRERMDQIERRCYELEGKIEGLRMKVDPKYANPRTPMCTCNPEAKE